MNSGFILGTTARESIIASDLNKFSTCFYRQGEEVIKITPEGAIFWKGREIETDDDFKLAMLDLKNLLTGVK